MNEMNETENEYTWDCMQYFKIYSREINGVHPTCHINPSYCIIKFKYRISLRNQMRGIVVKLTPFIWYITL